MIIRQVFKKPLPESLGILDIHNFAMANDLTIRFDYKDGKTKAYVLIAEIEKVIL